MRITIYLNQQRPILFEKTSRLIDAIDLHAYASPLFTYPRMEAKYASDQTYAQLISSGAIACDIYEEDCPDVFKIMRHRKLIE